MSTDLWGDFDVLDSEDNINALLRDQSTVLNSKSGGLLKGKVKQYVDDDDDMNYEFIIIAEKLSYRKNILQIYHSLTSNYPLKIISFALRETEICENFDELNSAVSGVLSGEVVTGLLRNLLQYSRNRDVPLQGIF